MGLYRRIRRVDVTIKNFGYLSIVNLFSMVSPILVYPLLLKALGAVAFGEIILAQTIGAYLAVLVNFGFNTSVVSDVSKNRSEKSQLSIIVSSVFVLKTILSMVAGIVLLFISIYFPIGDYSNALYTLTYISVFYHVFFPIWYYQGLERMKYITVINSIINVVYVLLILFFVNNEENYLLVPLFFSLSKGLGVLYSFYVLFHKERVKFVLPPWNYLIQITKDSFHLFVANVFGTLLLKGNVLVIGSFIGKAEVTYYSLAEKIISMISTIISNIGHVVLPRMALNDRRLVQIAFRVSIIISILSILLLGIFGEFIIEVLGGDAEKSYYVLLILSALIFFRALSPLLSNLIIVKGLFTLISRNLALSTLFYISVTISILRFGPTVNLLSVGITISMGFVFLHRLYLCYKHNLLTGVINRK